MEATQPQTKGTPKFWHSTPKGLFLGEALSPTGIGSKVRQARTCLPESAAKGSSAEVHGLGESCRYH